MFKCFIFLFNQNCRVMGLAIIEPQAMPQCPSIPPNRPYSLRLCGLGRLPPVMTHHILIYTLGLQQDELRSAYIWLVNIQ